MINPNELRIGSLVNYEQTTHRILTLGQTTCESICINSKSHLDTYERPYKEYAPIPLTEEWLERFGFTRLNKECPETGEYWEYELLVGNRYDGFHINYAEDFSLSIANCRETFENTSNYMTPDTNLFRNVHQIQMLYFTLTGEEMKIEL